MLLREADDDHAGCTAVPVSCALVCVRLCGRRATTGILALSTVLMTVLTVQIISITIIPLSGGHTVSTAVT
jgi:hypothetical protein